MNCEFIELGVINMMYNDLIRLKKNDNNPKQWQFDNGSCENELLF